MPIMRRRYEADASDLRRAGESQMVIAVPMRLLEPHALQADRNHGQTLRGLKSRGGLSACEAVAIIEDRDWRAMDAVASNRQLRTAIGSGDSP
jgi:hypothetical protein